MTHDSEGWTATEGVLATAAVAFTLLLHGAVPFLMMPTMGQAVWATGFSQSFANGPWYSIYAHDFGIPKPAAIAFGLAGAWPASLLIRAGVHAADAYSGMVAFWLVIAFVSACQIGRNFGATRTAALLGAVAWTSMPIIWAHAGYSMLSLGIGLLPFYFLAALDLFLFGRAGDEVTRSTVALYFLAVMVAAFMDGYTFMMFATGATILLTYGAVSRPEFRSTLLRIALPVHVASFALAYVLFSAYIGKSNFEAQPIDMFRGWGLDVSFIVIPTRGMHWLPDLLGISAERSEATQFGDTSVWATTFSLPVVLLGLAAWWLVRNHRIKVATGAMLVAAFSFYMALGPSLKINSTRPESPQLSHLAQQSPLMPAALAVMSTGNAWISETLPGFNVMKASYRWSALGVFSLWLLVMIGVAYDDRRNRMLWTFALLGLTVLNLPNIPKRWLVYSDARAMFQQIDQDLVSELRKQIRKGQTVAFVPWGNDFAANYLAPRAGFRAFNIGGDKNLADAQKQWPLELLALGGELNPGQASIAVKLLKDGTAGVLVVPYFHMLWSMDAWPCIEETTSMLHMERREEMRGKPGFDCPSQRREEVSPFVNAMRASPYVEVIDTRFFAAIRPRDE